MQTRYKQINSKNKKRQTISKQKEPLNNKKNVVTIDKDGCCEGRATPQEGAKLRFQGSQCLVWCGTVPLGKISSSKKPRVFTLTYFLLCVIGIILLHCLARERRFSHSSHMPARHYSIRICARTCSFMNTCGYSPPNSPPIHARTCAHIEIVFTYTAGKSTGSACLWAYKRAWACAKIHTNRESRARARYPMLIAARASARIRRIVSADP